jgi:sugar fermentation stimulation protein A
MPLVSLQLDIPEHVRTKKSAPFSSTDRFVKHITDLANSLQEHQRAILLTCFIYDNPGFKVTERSTNHDQVRAAVDKVAKAGVELWQVNFNISQYGVELVKYFRFQTDQI